MQVQILEMQILDGLENEMHDEMIEKFKVPHRTSFFALWPTLSIRAKESPRLRLRH